MPLHIRIAVLLFFVYTTSFCQTNRNLSFSSKDGLCSSKYYLDSTGVYFTAIVCEGRLTVDFGSYTLHANKVNFKFKSFNSLSPFVTIDQTPASNDTISKVTFLARYKKIIPDQSFAVDAIDSSGRFFKRFFLNDKGEIFINPHRYKSLRINYLNHFYLKQVYVNTVPFDLTIELSLPQEFFSPHHPLIDTRPGYSLILKPDGLYNSLGIRVALIEE